MFKFRVNPYEWAQQTGNLPDECKVCSPKKRLKPETLEDFIKKWTGCDVV